MFFVALALAPTLTRARDQKKLASNAKSKARLNANVPKISSTSKIKRSALVAHNSLPLLPNVLRQLSPSTRSERMCRTSSTPWDAPPPREGAIRGHAQRLGIVDPFRCNLLNRVGNDAVQQVIAAKGIYNCPGAVVTTNSTFTPEAEELARVHGVELVGGKLLRLRLQEVLGESWRSTLGRRGRELCAISAERLIFDVEGQSWGHLHCGRGFESFGVDLGG